MKLNMFDFDGTIADTQKPLFKAYAAAFRKATGTVLEEQVWRRNFGKDISFVFDHYGISIPDRRKIYNLKYDIYPQQYYQEIEMLPYAAYFYKKQGCKNVICSTTTRQVVQKVLRHNDRKKYFDVVYDRSDVLNLKPSPDIYWLAACGYCDVDEVNIFEDSQVGLQAALAFKQRYRMVTQDKIRIHKVEGDNGQEI